MESHTGCSDNRGRDEVLCGSRSLNDSGTFSAASMVVVARRKRTKEKRLRFEREGPESFCVLIYEKRNIGFFKIIDVT